MGIQRILFKLDEEEFKRLLLKNDELVEKLFPPRMRKNPDYCNLDKSWNFLNYLLSGTEMSDDGLLHDAILGGDALSLELDDDPVSYRSPKRVSAISGGLEAIDLDSLYGSTYLSCDAINDIDAGEELAEEGIESIREFFDNLVLFYSRAAEEGKGVLSYQA